ncbi:MAG: hypothetical protein FJX77_17810 [Armatimonadetes bacterium]|nr:hypothetical protein [Armatimonadota bacterium]
MRVAAPANPVWKARRQGLGITVELTSGALYRGTLIHNQAPWVTLQGRSGTERVRLMDGKELPATQVGFQTGFVLSLFREGRNLQVVVNGEKMLQRPVFTGAVRQVSLTLENFDAGASLFAISEVSYRTAERPAPTGDRSP